MQLITAGHMTPDEYERVPRNCHFRIVIYELNFLLSSCVHKTQVNAESTLKGIAFKHLIVRIVETGIVNYVECLDYPCHDFNTMKLE